jgi:hypothetical protein
MKIFYPVKKVFHLHVDEIFHLPRQGSEYNSSPLSLAMATFIIQSPVRRGDVECRPKDER